MILSDQCQHTTKIAVFGDPENITFKDAKEFGGSIFKQLDDSQVLDACNRTAATFRGWSVELLRLPWKRHCEVLLNALCPPRLQLQRRPLSISTTRHGIYFHRRSAARFRPRTSAAAFPQPLQPQAGGNFPPPEAGIESYGTGICKIYLLYKVLAQPRIEVTPNTSAFDPAYYERRCRKRAGSNRKGLRGGHPADEGRVGLSGGVRRNERCGSCRSC